MTYFISLGCGIIFGLGLIISGMVNPAKVLNFFDVAGQWDPTLALVFVAAIGTALPLYQWALRRRQAPVSAEKFHLPDNKAVTPSLIGGSLLFGIGWGLTGFCPGPALTSVASLLSGSLIFVAFLFTGAACYRYLIAR